MANYVESFASKLDWAMPFQRTGKFPLDRTDLFSSYDDAVKYAAGNVENPDSRGLCGTSYVGQIITVFENDTVTVYKINANRTLEIVGKPYELTAATAEKLGGIKVGAGLAISEDGTLSATGGGTADAVDWANVIGKPDLVQGNLFLHGAASISGLKSEVVAGITAGKLALNGVYQSSLTVEGTVYKATIIINSAELPIIFLYKGNEAWITTAVKDGNGNYSEEIFAITNKALTAEDLTALHAVIDANYVHTDNNFTTALLEKLNGIATGAQKNVQADWNETDETSDAFIKNKPTALSAFVNDKNFVDSTVENLVNYYKKTEIDDLLSGISTLDILVVDALPTENISKTTIYLVLKPSDESENQNVYEEYIWVESKNSWEVIGDTVINLSNYLQKDGDASNTTVSFTVPGERVIPTSGATLAVLIGTVIRYLSDLATVAFTGSYNDLVDKPEITVLHRAVQTISAGQTEVTFNGLSNIVSVFAQDASTHEAVILNWTDDGEGALVCTLGNAHSNDIKITVFYVVE